MTEKEGFVTINNEFLIREITEILGAPSKDVSNRKKYHDLVMKIYVEWIKDHDVKDVLKNLITNCQCIDWALYLSNKRYRDHYQHQFNVGALGSFLLDIYVSKEDTLCDIIAKQYEKKLKDVYKWKPEDVHTAWWISSLFHDHGYPIYYLFSVIPMMRTITMQEFKDLRSVKSSLDKMEEGLKKGYYKLLCFDLGNSLSKSPEDAKEDLRTTVRNGLDLLGFPGKIESELKDNIYDHGVLSAINLALKLNEEEDFKFDYVLKEAAKAIALHNNTKIEVKFVEDPLAFLLILCDELQEWGRKMIISDDFVSELKQIALGPFLENGNNKEFSEFLKVKFEYEDAKILRDTNWSYELFKKSKLENFKRLKFPDMFKPQKLEFEVRIPSSI